MYTSVAEGVKGRSVLTGRGGEGVLGRGEEGGLYRRSHVVHEMGESLCGL